MKQFRVRAEAKNTFHVKIDGKKTFKKDIERKKGEFDNTVKRYSQLLE